MSEFALDLRLNPRESDPADSLGEFALNPADSFSEHPIGIFDSGVGGLTVAREVIAALPGENIVYFGDTARVPYGSKSRETVTRYSRQIVGYLLTRGVKAVIIACNTASALSCDALRAEYSVPIIEMVRHGVSGVVRSRGIRSVGVIGTEMTVRSDAYGAELRRLRPDIRVESRACPLFVPLAEEGWTDNAVAELTAREYLSGFAESGVDALILGCTHYPLLAGVIGRAVPGAAIVNPAAAAAAETRSYLAANGLLNESGKPPSYSFHVSDATAKFGVICERVLGRAYEPEVVDLDARG
ncbi:MAG: glutamate racemase [Clostridiales bacterium]|jgi:glutamate racemase|nr:glutamate racemase [Clostridiales bacterium]